MAFEFGKSSIKKSKYPKGVFVDLITVTKAENSKSKFNDCSIYVEGEPTMGKYPKKFFLGGNHYMEKGVPCDWGNKENGTQDGSWKLDGFLKSAGVEEKNQIKEDGNLTDEVLRDLIGRKVYILQYESNGKYSRDTWFFFGKEDGGKEWLLEKWGKMTPPKSYKHQSSNKKLNSLWNEMPVKSEEEAKKKDDTQDFLDSLDH